MSDKIDTIATGIGKLKLFYEGPIKDQFNEDLPILRGADKRKKGWSGATVQRPLKVRRNQGIGAVADGGVLPAIGRQTVVQAAISSKYNYLRFGITGPMIKASMSNAGSFVRDAAYELEEGYKDLKNDMNRQLSYDGTGTLARANAAAVASTSLVIKGREDTEEALKFVDVGLVFDVVSSSAVIASGIEVLSISGSPSAATATLTLSQAVTVSANDTIIRSGSLNNEVQGLLYALDGGTTTIYSIDRSLYTQYQGNVIDNGAAQLTLDYMQRLYNEGLRRGASKYSAIYCDFNSLRMYQKLLTADKRYVNTNKGDGGFAAKDQFYLDFNGVAMVPDKDCPPRLFFLPEEVITNYVLCDLEFADESGGTGGMIAQTSQDAYEVRIRFFNNLFNEQPAACSVAKNYISP